MRWLLSVALLVGLSGCAFYYDSIWTDVTGQNRPESAQRSDRESCDSALGLKDIPDAADARIADCMNGHGWKRTRIPRRTPRSIQPKVQLYQCQLLVDE